MKTRLATAGLVIATTFGMLMLGVSLAPAAVEKPEMPTFAVRPLPLEWNGARPDPDLDRMFRRDAPARPSLDAMFRRR